MQLKFSQAVSEVGLLHDIRLSANNRGVATAQASQAMA